MQDKVPILPRHWTIVAPILPTLMQYQPYVTVLAQEGEIDLIGKYRKILDEALAKLTI